MSTDQPTIEQTTPNSNNESNTNNSVNTTENTNNNLNNATTNSKDNKSNENNNKKKKPYGPRAYTSAAEGGKQLLSRKETGCTKQRVALLFGYVGTGYYGLQWDDKGEYPTIEKELEDAIFKMGGIMETNHGNLDRVHWARGSRTDKGVHALGNVVSLFMELPPDTFNGDKLGLKVADKINANLPPAIRVFSVIRVTRKFNPREQCAVRTYNLIWPRKYINENIISLEGLRDLMRHYEGHHDFHNFTRAQHCYRPIPSSASSSTTSANTSSSDSSSSSSSSSTTVASSSSATTSVPAASASESSSAVEPTPAVSAVSIKTAGKEDDDSSDDDVADDMGGEVQAKDKKKPQQKNSKPPRGQRAPPRREDQITYYVHHNSYSRRMIYVAPETPFKLGDEDWIPFKFVGESFAYNQIRKMLGFVLHISQGHVPQGALPMALKSPFKINVPMTPGQPLYLLGGTYLDRHHTLIDMFDFLPEGELNNTGKFDHNSKSLRWHHLLETAYTTKAQGAVVLQRMKDFRDNILHPHIFSLYQQNNFCQEFNEGIKQERFYIPDFAEAQALFEVWEKEEKERKEKKRQRFAELEEERAKKYRAETKGTEKKEETIEKKEEEAVANTSQ